MKLLKFSADWCQPCKALSLELAKVDLKNIELVEFDANEHAEVFREWGIRSVPTLYLINDDDLPVRAFTGFKSKEKIEEFLSLYTDGT
jgi:thioredoxin-like negative regulator of GroEL